MAHDHPLFPREFQEDERCSIAEACTHCTREKSGRVGRRDPGSGIPGSGIGDQGIGDQMLSDSLIPDLPPTPDPRSPIPNPPMSSAESA